MINKNEMKIRNDIDSKIAECMRSKQTALLSAYRMIKTEIMEADKVTGAYLGDDMLLELLRSMQKKREKTMFVYREMCKTELAAQEEVEIQVISRYLPAPIGELEIGGLLRQITQENQLFKKSDFGNVMRLLGTKCPAADKGIAAKLLKEILI